MANESIKRETCVDSVIHETDTRLELQTDKPAVVEVMADRKPGEEMVM